MNVIASALVLVVENPAASSRFFCGLLGFRETLEADRLVMLSRDDSAPDLTLIERDLEQPPSRAPRPVISLAVSGIAGEAARLAAAGAPITEELRRDPSGEWRMRLTDPNGLVVELTERTP